MDTIFIIIMYLYNYGEFEDIKIIGSSNTLNGAKKVFNNWISGNGRNVQNTSHSFLDEWQESDDGKEFSDINYRNGDGQIAKLVRIEEIPFTHD